MQIIKNMTYDQERALYGATDIEIVNCRFDGPADGESALKESHDVKVRDSYFNLRYPFWHDHTLEIDNCELTANCRAALWASRTPCSKYARMRVTSIFTRPTMI